MLIALPLLATVNIILNEIEFLKIVYIHQFSSVAQSCPTLCDPMNRSLPGLPVHHQLRSSLKVTSIESVMPSSHLILCNPLLLLPPIPPSIGVFSNKSTLCMRWPEYWSFSFSIIPSKEHPGLISFTMDWLDHLAVEGTLKSLLQHHTSKASILQCSAIVVVVYIIIKGFPAGSDGKESACNPRDLGSIPGLGRSPGGGNGNLLQYSC